MLSSLWASRSASKSFFCSSASVWRKASSALIASSSAFRYVGEREENYLTNTWHRKQIGPFGLKNSVTIADGYRLLKDGQTVQIGDFKVQAFLVPGHTLGHLCYLIDDELLFTGDSIALNKDGGWCFFDIFNYDSKMNMESLKAMRNKLNLGRIRTVFTSHNGFTDDPESAFRHIDTIPTLKKGRPFDEAAPYDCFQEKDESSLDSERKFC